MAEQTSYTLLSRMKVDDGIPWEEFHHKYHDLLIFYGQYSGLSPTEQEELVNDILVELFNNDRRSLFRYDRTQGKFRSYLKTIAIRRAVDILRRRSFAGQIDLCIVNEAVCIDDFTEQEKKERRKFLVQEVLAEMKRTLPPQQFIVFKSCAIDGEKAADVAADYRLSLSNVYTIKSRAQNMFRKIYTEADEYI